MSNALLGRPIRLDRRGILTHLRAIAVDRGSMLELRRLLAEELARSSIHHLRDDVVLEMLADRYMRGLLELVLVHPVEPELPSFLLDEAPHKKPPAPTNTTGDTKPSPIVPAEYPVLARLEADSIIDTTLRLVNRLSELLFGMFARNKRGSTLARVYEVLGEADADATARLHSEIDLSLGFLLHTPAFSSRSHTPIPQPSISEARWSADRVGVGKDVDATFQYAGFAAGKPVTVSFFECNRDGSRKWVDEVLVQVDGEAGQHRVPWKRKEDAANADLEEDGAEGDSGPVEYRFTAEAWRAGNSGESGPLWLTNTVTITLDDTGEMQKPYIVVLKDAEREMRTKATQGKATFENVLVGPIEVRILHPKFQSIEWSKPRVPVGVPVEGIFTYEDALAGTKVRVLVQEMNADGTATLAKEIELMLEAEHGQACFSFTRAEDEAEADIALDEQEGDRGPLEYRFHIETEDGASSEVSGPLFLTHTVVFNLDHEGDESLPDGTELLILAADGTEHRSALIGGEARFEGVVCGPMAVKLA